jgi:glycosyltransferase involved in cell wall biosynthesis
VLIPATRFFDRYSRRWSAGRYWMLFFDRTWFALRALSVGREPVSLVIVTRDLVACFWFLALKWIVRKPVVYEMHTLEQVMFSRADPHIADYVDDQIAIPLRAITAGAFAGYQDDNSIPGRLYSRFITWVENWTIRHAAAVLPLTETIARDLRSKLGANDIQVVPSGHCIRPAELPDRNQCRRRLNLPINRRIALYAGLSFHDKGLHLVFATARHLPADCMIVVVGAEPDRATRLNALRDDLGLHDRLLIAPRVPHHRVAEYLRAADVGLLLYPPTRYLSEFSSPLKLVEYLACGLPIVATDLPALRELVADGETGIFVPYDDVVAIAGRLVDILHDDLALQRLSAGAAASGERYSYAQRARRIEAAISHALQTTEPAWCACT